VRPGYRSRVIFRWQKEYGGPEVDQARRMKDLERENIRLKRLAAELSLEKQIRADEYALPGAIIAVPAQYSPRC